MNCLVCKDVHVGCLDSPSEVRLQDHVKQLSSSAWSEQSMVPSQSWASVMQRPSTQRNSPVGQGDTCALVDPPRGPVGRSSLLVPPLFISGDSSNSSAFSDFDSASAFCFSIVIGCQYWLSLRLAWMVRLVSDPKKQAWVEISK